MALSKFVFKCIRVKNTAKPLKSRCGKSLGKNGILCDACYADAKKDKVPILMCNDVSHMFNIPFKNQVFVYIDLSSQSIKPDSKNIVLVRQQQFRKDLNADLMKLGMEELTQFYTSVGLNGLDEITKLANGDKYRMRYFLTKNIVDELIELGKKVTV